MVITLRLISLFFGIRVGVTAFTDESLFLAFMAGIFIGLVLIMGKILKPEML